MPMQYRAFAFLPSGERHSLFTHHQLDTPGLTRYTVISNVLILADQGVRNMTGVYRECKRCFRMYFHPYRGKGKPPSYCPSCAPVVRKQKTRDRVRKHRSKPIEPNLTGDEPSVTFNSAKRLSWSAIEQRARELMSYRRAFTTQRKGR